MGEPLTKEEFIKRHSAFFQSIGFDVQFAGCIYYMLGLNMSDTLTYEREDDFVIKRLVNGEVYTEYYQVKYSKNGGRMVDSDEDFWKSLDNWQLLYKTSPQEERKTFFTKGNFIILTNKTPQNFLYDKIKDLHDGLIEIDDVRNCISQRLKDNPSYSESLEALNKLEPILLRQFLHKVEIIHFDDFIASMYESFLTNFYRPTNADTVVKLLVGAFWEFKQKCNGKFEFNGKTFTDKFKDILECISSQNAIILDKTDEPTLDDENMDDVKMMIEQLKSIKVVSDKANKNNFSLQIYLTKYYRLKNALLRFKITHLMTERSELDFDSAAEWKWKNIFQQKQLILLQKDENNEVIEDDEKINAGRDTLNTSMNSPFEIAGQKTEEELAAGWYLKLSNLQDPKIVWHFDWFKKYINKK